MNRFHLFIAAALLAIVVFVGTSFWTFRGLDRAVNGALNDGTDLEFEPKYIPTFTAGLGFPDDVKALAQVKAETLLTGADLAKRYEALRFTSQERLIKQCCAVKSALEKRSPHVWTLPTIINICAASPDFHAVRDFGRVSGLVGRYLIASGKTGEGVELLESIAFLGPSLALDYPERATLILHMISIALFGIAADSFTIAAGDLKPDHAQALAIGESLDRAFSLLPPMSYPVGLERLVIPSFPEAYRKRAMKTGAGTQLEAEFKRVAAAAEPHLKMIFDPWIPALDMSWKGGSAVLSKVQKNNDLYLREHLSLDRPMSYVRRLTRPHESVAATMLQITLPNCEGAFRGAWKTYQRIEGAKTVLALEAFRKEIGRLPATIEELAAWWKKPIGRDLFADTAMQYDPKRPSLSSVGPDEKPGTSDDVVFLPLEGMVKN